MSITSSPEAAIREVPRRLRVARDPFVDTLRVVAIGLVVIQHWLMPVIHAGPAGDLVSGNALTAPGAWVVTWISQVMPLIFFTGGAAAAYSASRGMRGGTPATARAWIARRVVRLVTPVLPLVAVWVPLPHLLISTGVPADTVALGARLVGALLWFLAVYTVVVAATPLMLRWHDRWRGAEIAVLAATAVAMDVARFTTGIEVWGYANVVCVWFAVYLVGVMYADGHLDRVTGRIAWLLAAAGFGITAAAVAVGPYAASMIGMPGAALSNMNPPTAILLGLTAGQLGLVLALRPQIVRWSALPEVSRAIAVLSKRLMTIYVWHTPALVAVAGVAALGFGWSTPSPFGADWRESMPMWLAALTVVLALAVRAFGRLETAGTGSATTPTTPVIVGAVVLIGAGLLILTIGGFVPSPDGITVADGPLTAALALVVGTALLRIRRITGPNSAPARERLNP